MINDTVYERTRALHLPHYRVGLRLAVALGSATQACLPIRATTAGWSGQHSGTTYYLGGIAFANSCQDWPVSHDGDIFHSGNGGKSWVRQLPQQNNQLTSVAFADGKHGWVVGSDEFILYTRDGGAHWVTQPSGTSNPLRSFLYGVSVLDAQHAWAAGENGTILAYTQPESAP